MDTTTFYVNWANHEILTEKDFEAIRDDKADEYFNDADFVNDYLDRHGYSAFDILMMSPVARDTLADDLYLAAIDEVGDDNGNYEKIIWEI